MGSTQEGGNSLHVPDRAGSMPHLTSPCKNLHVVNQHCGSLCLRLYFLPIYQLTNCRSLAYWGRQGMQMLQAALRQGWHNNLLPSASQGNLRPIGGQLILFKKVKRRGSLRLACNCSPCPRATGSNCRGVKNLGLLVPLKEPA